jgi:hypothetical protein
MCTHCFQTTTAVDVFDFHKFEITNALADLNTKPRIDPAMVNALTLADRLVVDLEVTENLQRNNVIHDKY